MAAASSRGGAIARRNNSTVKFLLENSFIIVAIRIALGAIFIFASIDKIADPNAFAVSIGYYKLVGQSTAMIIATILPWVELISGIFLIFGIMMHGSSLLALVMLCIFTGGVISGIARGLDISCGCFTRDPNVDKIGWMKVAENFGLILLSLILLFSKSDRFSIKKMALESTGGNANDK